MSVRLFSHVSTGLAALTVSAVVLAPATGSVARPEPPVARTQVGLAAATTPLVVEAWRPEKLAAAREAMQRVDPVAADRLPAALAAPASSWLDAGYQWLQGWVTYGVELTQYVLQFVPLGYVIGDQIGIVYYNLVVPVANSVVYDLIDPVLADPLNVFTWINGAAAVASTTVAALINTGIAELNHFFGWLIPPIPPLPFAARDATDLSSTAVVAATVEPVEQVKPVEPVKQVEQVVPPADIPVAEPPHERVATLDASTPPPPEKTPTTTTLGTVQAQGEVRSGATATVAVDEPGPRDTKDATSAPASSPADVDDARADVAKETSRSAPASRPARETATPEPESADTGTPAAASHPAQGAPAAPAA